MSGWEDEKVDKWKSLLFDWRKKWENKKGNLYKLIYLSLLKKNYVQLKKNKSNHANVIKGSFGYRLFC